LTDQPAPGATITPHPGQDPAGDHVWVGAATVQLNLKQAKHAVLRGSIRIPEAAQIVVLEIYCLHCRRPYEDVVDEPCIHATFREHLHGGPIGTRRKRRHDFHRCDLLGCDIDATVPQPPGKALTA
jgi:hypothetical protein